MRKKKVSLHPKLVLDKQIIVSFSNKKQPNGARCESYASGPCNRCSAVVTLTDVLAG